MLLCHTLKLKSELLLNHYLANAAVLHADNLDATMVLVNNLLSVESVHYQKNGIEKALIACNIVFDDEKMAKILASGKFDKDSIEKFIKLLNYLKCKIKNNSINENDKRYLTIADNYAKKLVTFFNKYIGGCDINIIINKINEILSFKPELLDDKQTKHTR